jgi:hypothetical protein
MPAQCPEFEEKNKKQIPNDPDDAGHIQDICADTADQE